MGKGEADARSQEWAFTLHLTSGVRDEFHNFSLDLGEGLYFFNHPFSCFLCSVQLLHTSLYPRVLPAPSWELC